MGLVGAWIFYKFGHILGTLDVPKERSSHKRAIPKSGGIGILAAFILFAVLFDLKKSFWIPAALLSLISFVGDRSEVRQIVRLFIQFGCSFIFLAGCFAPLKLNMEFFVLMIFFSIFITGTANIYNFMDGVDGIAGIIGIVGFSLLAFYAHIVGFDDSYRVLCIAFAFACLGFLCLNLPHAKVFLGDVGSILLGFVFACLMVTLSENVTDFFIMAGFLMVFYVDEFFTIIIRIRGGDPLMRPHRKHIYQLLANELAVSHWKVAFLYGIIQLCVGLSAIYAGLKDLFLLLLVYILYCFLFAVIAVKVHRKSSLRFRYQ